MAVLRFEERAALLPEARRPRTRLLGFVLLATAAAAALAPAVGRGGGGLCCEGGGTGIGVGAGACDGCG